MRRAGGAAMMAIALAACGLDLSGTAQETAEGGAPADAATLDAIAHVEGGSDAAPPIDGANGGPDSTPDTIGGNDGGGETDCLDGIDNDNNGKTDCADPACNPVVTCVPATPPVGWNGYSILDESGAAACPSGYTQATIAYSGFSALPATCSACSCTAAGATCTGPTQVRCSGNQNCTANPQSTTPAGPTCTTSSFTIDVSDQCAASSIAPTGSRCDASQVVATKPPPQFAKSPRICASPKEGGGCAAGNKCVARGGPGFTGICVAQSLAQGQPAVACPAGWSTRQIVTSPTPTSYSDTRDCTPCSCSGAPSGAACSVDVRLYTSNDCTNGAQTAIPGDGVCRANIVAQDGTQIRSVRASITTNQGTCAAASGGQATGSAQPTAQTEYCCR